MSPAIPEAAGGVAPARAIAARVLERVGEGAYADRAFAGEARRSGIGSRDRALAQGITFGVVQRRRTLDWLIDAEVHRAAALEPRVRDILRIGAYELCFLDGIPARATVNEAVNAARALQGSETRRRARGGLVNAVLRRVVADGRGRLASLRDEDPAEAALAHSVPDSLAESLFRSLGPADARAVLAAANRGSESAIRWNPLRGPRLTLERMLPARPERDPLVPEAVVLSSAFSFEDSPAWARGLGVPQSRSSMLPARVLAPRRGERILDLCAAPGVKATHLAALAPGARVTAVEIHGHRARALALLARRLGAPIEVIVGDALTVSLEGPFDAVLVDAPCTGYGVLAGRPDSRWRERDVLQLASLQGRLLARALDLVRPGGRVVYSTCTLTREENEDVVRGSGAGLDPLGERFPGLGHPRLPGAILALPHRYGSDGFFVASLVA